MLFVTGGLIDETISRWFIVLLAGLGLALPPCRKLMLSRGMVLLVLIVCSLAAAFSFNGLVVGGRFTYPVAGFGSAWALSLAWVALRSQAALPLSRVRFCFSIIVVLTLVLNVTFLYKRVWSTAARHRSMTTLIETVRAAQRERPDGRIDVYFVNPDVEHAAVYLKTLGCS